MTRAAVRQWFARRRAVYSRWFDIASNALSLRDVAILAGLALVWFGLAAIYQPLAPLVIGAFLLWYTTIRRAAP